MRLKETTSFFVCNCCGKRQTDPKDWMVTRWMAEIQGTEEAHFCPNCIAWECCPSCGKKPRFDGMARGKL